MAVMVDPLREYPHVPWTTKRWCHMAADAGFDELHAFAGRLGLPRRAFQRDHYDLTPALRARAVALGAEEVPTGELLARMAGPRGDRARARRARRAPSAWPATREELDREQERLARERPAPWRPGPEPVVAGVFVCFPRGGEGRGASGDPAWAAAVAMRGAAVVGEALRTGAAEAPYEPGRLALREGPLLEAAVRGLGAVPDVLLVDGTAGDHPRGAGLALHLGAVLDLPTVGVTHRPLLAAGDWPAGEAAGAARPLLLGGEVVGCWLRTRPRVRPLAVHPAWRTDAATAREVVLRSIARARTPEPLRAARHLARRARAADGR